MAKQRRNEIDGFTIRGRPTPRVVAHLAVLKLLVKDFLGRQIPLQAAIAKHLAMVIRMHPNVRRVHYGVILNGKDVILVSSVDLGGSTKAAPSRVVELGLLYSHCRGGVRKHKTYEVSPYWRCHPYINPRSALGIALANRLKLRLP